VKVFSSSDGAIALSGAAAAAVAGIMLGGAMQPQLFFEDRPMGPQMFADGGGPRSTGPFDLRDAYTAYGGKLPPYVIGTDYAQTAYVEAPPVADERPQVARKDLEDPAPAALTRAGYGEAPAPVVVYPSVNGGSAYGAETPPQPAPPEDEPPVVIG
jgi:hypothetical protein